MSLEATKKADMATARAEAADAKVNNLENEIKNLKRTLSEAEAEIKQYQEYAPDLAMLKYPDEPLMALWEVLKDERLEGPAAAMKIINDPKCGVDRSITVEVNDPFWSMALSNTSIFTTLVCVFAANRVDVFNAIVDAYGDSLQDILESEKGWLLRASSICGHVAFLKFLSDWEIDLNVPAATSKLTALHLAASNGHVECVKELILCEAKIDVKDQDGLQPLHIAAEEGHAQIVEYLVSKGADVKAVCNRGYGPLFYARGSGDEATIRYLDSQGATLKEYIE